jgi:aconitate hydratase
MGILPLQFTQGDTCDSLGLTGREVYDVVGIADGLTPGGTVTVRVQGDDGQRREFEAKVRIDSAIEVDYYRHGGVLQMVLRRLLHESQN